MKLDKNRLESAVHGCWLGKNIGGTLGAPMEGKTEMNSVTFYTQKNPGGNPEPNDDLDLQLVWLTMAEYHGIDKLSSRLFGEYWINAVTFMANEYATCQKNCRHGFYPPVSGILNNDQWKWSNGAWIRSEIWACLFPGDPDRAIQFAWMDASCDHTGEGIYAEMFTAALESAAFVEKDLRKLIDIGLSKIPADSRIHKSIDFICACFDGGDSRETAREKVMKFNADLGYFQAPSNIAFAVIGLLYGNGDFGKSVCTAVNCGDDTDCTAATVGAILGIMYGAENIPAKWIEPIGDKIITMSFNTDGLPVPYPKTITELTHRVCALRQRIAANFPHEVPQELKDDTIARQLWARPSWELPFDLGFVKLGIEYLDTAVIAPGERSRIRVHVYSPLMYFSEFRFRWKLENGWKSGKPEFFTTGEMYCHSAVDTDLIAPEAMTEAISYVTLEIRDEKRSAPTVVNVPFQRKECVNFPYFVPADLDLRTRQYYHTTMKLIKPGNKKKRLTDNFRYRSSPVFHSRSEARIFPGE